LLLEEAFIVLQDLWFYDDGDGDVVMMVLDLRRRRNRLKILEATLLTTMLEVKKYKQSVNRRKKGLPRP
jgi:hypothetical protein